jgi:hypothetical protein
MKNQMDSFICKVIVIMIAILLSLWIIKMNDLEPRIRIKHQEVSSSCSDKYWYKEYYR